MGLREPGGTRLAIEASIITFWTWRPAGAFGTRKCQRLTRLTSSPALSRPRSILIAIQMTNAKYVSLQKVCIRELTGIGRRMEVSLSRMDGNLRRDLSSTDGRDTAKP